MARPSRLSIAKADIVQLFRDQQRRIFRKTDIDRILAENRKFWRLSEATTVNKFLHFLLNATELREERIEFPQRPAVRFTWGEVESLSIIQSINPSGYFSHYTAMLFHGLTEQLPKSVYFNQEQRATGGGGRLTQAAINNAFRGKCRVTQNVAPFRDQQVHLLSGKNTNCLGVIPSSAADGAELRVTSVERTLIDAAVRPVYSGGVFEVAKAFSRAHGTASVNRLVATLKRLDFTYPYNQAIGFYMQRSGLYSSGQLEMLREIPIELDFYLDYGLKQTDYVPEWRLFVPKGF